MTLLSPRLHVQRAHNLIGLLRGWLYKNEPRVGPDELWQVNGFIQDLEDELSRALEALPPPNTTPVLPPSHNAGWRVQRALDDNKRISSYADQLRKQAGALLDVDRLDQTVSNQRAHLKQLQRVVDDLELAR